MVLPPAFLSIGHMPTCSAPITLRREGLHHQMGATMVFIHSKSEFWKSSIRWKNIAFPKNLFSVSPFTFPRESILLKDVVCAFLSTVFELLAWKVGHDVLSPSFLGPPWNLLCYRNKPSPCPLSSIHSCRCTVGFVLKVLLTFEIIYNSKSDLENHAVLGYVLTFIAYVYNQYFLSFIFNR